MREIENLRFVTTVCSPHGSTADAGLELVIYFHGAPNEGRLSVWRERKRRELFKVAAAYRDLGQPGAPRQPQQPQQHDSTAQHDEPTQQDKPAQFDNRTRQEKPVELVKPLLHAEPAQDKPADQDKPRQQDMQQHSQPREGPFWRILGALRGALSGRKKDEGELKSSENDAEPSQTETTTRRHEEGGQLQEESPQGERKLQEEPPQGERKLQEASPQGGRKLQEESPEGERKLQEESPRGERKLREKSRDDSAKMSPPAEGQESQQSKPGGQRQRQRQAAWDQEWAEPPHHGWSGLLPAGTYDCAKVALLRAGFKVRLG